MFRCESGLEVILGEYDGTGSIITRVDAHSRVDSLGVTTLHEVCHYAFQIGTPWGAAYFRMTRADSEGEEFADSGAPASLPILSHARRLHEMYATLFSVGNSSEAMESMASNLEYLAYWGEANGLRVRLIGDNVEWEDSLELLFDKLFADGRLAELRFDSSQEAFRRLLEECAPDRRYQLLRDSLSGSATSLDRLKEIMTFGGASATREEQLTAFLNEIGLDTMSQSDTEAFFDSLLPDLGTIGSGKAGELRVDDQPSSGEADVHTPLLLSDAIMILADVERLRLRDGRIRLSIVDSRLTAGTKVPVHLAHDGSKPYVVLAQLSAHSLSTQFELASSQVVLPREFVRVGLMSAVLGQCVDLFENANLKQVYDYVQDSRTDLIWMTTSSSRDYCRQVPSDLEDLIVVVDRARSQIMQKLVRNWMFVSYQSFSVSGLSPLTAIVLQSGGRPKPRYLFFATKLVSERMVQWLERQSNCQPDPDLNMSGIRQLAPFVSSAFYEIGGFE